MFVHFLKKKIPVLKMFYNFYIFYNFLKFEWTQQLEVRKSSKSGPEKVRIELKSPDFHHYSSLDPVVRNAKFCIGPTANYVQVEHLTYKIRVFNLCENYEFAVALFDTQIDSIQCLNFAQNWFNSIFDSKSFHENSI